MKTRRRAVLVEIWLPVCIIAIWWLATARGTSLVFPPVQDILVRFREIYFFERFTSDVLPSLAHLAIGYGIAAIAGVVGGIAIATVPWAEAAASPYVHFLRSLPSPAIVPIFIVVLGFGAQMKITIIALGALWPILLNTIDGVRGVDATLKETAAACQLGRRYRLTHVIAPGASPQIMTGLRLGLQVSILLMAVSEMIASTDGVGYLILRSQQQFHIPDLWAGMIYLGLLGYLFNMLFTLAERVLLKWYIGARAAETK